MADCAVQRELVLNSLLCFLVNTRKKYPGKVIKSIIIDFYDLDAVNAARDRLVQDVAKIANVSFKIPRERRDSNNKLKIEIDDVIQLFDHLDDNGHLNSLPRYVTDNFSDVPMLRMESDGIPTILSKLVELKDSINTLGMGYSKVHHKHAGGSQGEMLCDTEGELSQQEVSDVDGAGSISDVFQEPSYHRRKKRPRNRSKPSPGAEPQIVVNDSEFPPLQKESRVGRPTYSGAITKPSENIKSIHKRSYRIVGVADQITTSCKLSSAKPHVNKAFYALYNVGNDESVESVSNFIKELCGVEPISVFRVGVSDTEGAASNKPLMFRVCIEESVSSKFLIPQAWANGIVIKKWKFKPKQTDSNKTNANSDNGGKK